MGKLNGSLSMFFDGEAHNGPLHFEQKDILDQFDSCNSLGDCLEAITESISYAYPHLRACILLADSSHSEIEDCFSFDFPKSFGRSLKGEPINWAADRKKLLANYDVLACHSTPIF